MACIKHGLFSLAFAAVSVPLLFSGVVFVSACSKLTEPAKDEPMIAESADAGDSTGDLKAKLQALASAAASGSASASAAPMASASAPAMPDEKPGIKDTLVGKGAEAKSGDTVSVHYVGTLPNGTEFDSSRKHGKPFDFPLGGGRVIKCWDQGVAGMKVGGKRTLTCPPSIAYGARGYPPVIPPNSTLNFDVELLEIKAKK